MKAKKLIKSLTVASFLFLCSCTSGPVSAAEAAGGRMRSLFTGLNEKACTKATDRDNPDEIDWLICPGVSGYHLQVRGDDTGESVTVVNPAKQEFPLNYYDFVTHRLGFYPDDKAEWRVRMDHDTPVPIALMVRVMVPDMDNPTHNHPYWTVAKITADKVCVTDSIPEGSKTKAQVLVLADSAAGRPCAPPLSDPDLDALTSTPQQSTPYAPPPSEPDYINTLFPHPSGK